MTQADRPSVLYHDTSLHVWFDDPADPAVRRTFLALASALRRMGYAIGPCERTRERYPSLAKYHRRGHHGDLWVTLNHGGRHIEAAFFQDRVIDNPNGNEYDFGKLGKLPYLLRLRFLLTRRKLLALLAARGIPATDRDWRDDRDPLEAFNRGWGGGRFRRGPDGWPDESELKSWRRQDGDGVVVHQGERRFVQIRGRWCAVRVHGGINGMWHCYSGGRLVDQANVARLRSAFPGRGRRVDREEAERHLRRDIDRAVEARDYLRATRHDAALRRMTGEAPIAPKNQGRIAS